MTAPQERALMAELDGLLDAAIDAEVGAVVEEEIRPVLAGVRAVVERAQRTADIRAARGKALSAHNREALEQLDAAVVELHRVLTGREA